MRPNGRCHTVPDGKEFGRARAWWTEFCGLVGVPNSKVFNKDAFERKLDASAYAAETGLVGLVERYAIPIPADARGRGHRMSHCILLTESKAVLGNRLQPALPVSRATNGLMSPKSTSPSSLMSALYTSQFGK